jgi:hypothetical protein
VSSQAKFSFLSLSLSIGIYSKTNQQSKGEINLQTFLQKQTAKHSRHGPIHNLKQKGVKKPTPFFQGAL